jgi:hypothetical protein
MGEKKFWKVVAGVSAFGILYSVIEAFNYDWMNDSEGQNCFKLGMRDGRENLFRFIYSLGQEGNIDFLQPRGPESGLNNCQKAFHHGYNVGITLPASVAGASAYAASVAYRRLAPRQGSAVPV